MRVSEKWWIVGLLGIDYIGRKMISMVYGASDYREMILRVIKGQELEKYQGAMFQIAFSAVLWALLPLWGGFITQQPGRGCLLASACLLISALLPLLNLTSLFFGIGSYLYLLNRSTKERST